MHVRMRQIRSLPLELGNLTRIEKLDLDNNPGNDERECVCVRARAHACVCSCACSCACVCVCALA